MATKRPTPHALGEQLRALRVAAGMSLPALAQAAGGRISTSYIGMIEQGRRVPPASTLDELLEGMNASKRTAADMRKLRAEVAPNVRNRPDPATTVPEGWDRLSQRDRRMVHALITRLAGDS